jgi:hypothetical protein
VTAQANTGPRFDCSTNFGAAPSGDTDVDRDENDRNDDAYEKGREFECALIAGVYQPVGDSRSDERPERAEQDRHDDADVLPTRKDEPGECTNNEADEDCADNRSDRFCSLARLTC